MPVVKSATDFKDMSEIDITFGVTEDQFVTYQQDFVSRQEDQNDSKLIYSPAD